MSARRPLTRLRGRAAGFSFIEILVVMGIIAVLAGLGIVIIGIMGRRGPREATKATLNKVKLNIDTWKLHYRDYPPSTLEGLVRTAGLPVVKYSSRNSTNEAIEALYQALHAPGFAGNAEIGEQEYRNLDDDKLQLKITDRGLDLREIVDNWGNPLVYFVNTEYVKYEQNPPTYDTVNGDQVNPKPYRDSGGGFVNPNGFQLYSMGENGLPNDDDDLKAWQD